MKMLIKEKKGVLLFMLCAACAFGAGGCNESNDNSSSEQADHNSSHYSVNYTDTGDGAISFGNSSASVDHSAVSPNESSAMSTENGSSRIDAKSSALTSKTFSSAASSGTMTKTIITYYYYDEDGGEHTTDTEVYVMTDTESESSSEADSGMTDTDTNTDSSSDTSTDSSIDTDTIFPAGSGEFTEEDLIFWYNDAAIYFGADIGEVTALIGEPKHISNIPNPLNSEYDKKTYNYDHFSIETVPNEDGTIYTVVGIQIFDDAVSTQKGVRIGMTIEQAAEVYGSNAMMINDEYRYYIGQNYMYFYVQNGIIANIGYGYDGDFAETE